MISGSVEPLALLIDNVQEDPEFSSHTAAELSPGIRSFIGVPVVLSNGTFYGTLCAVDSEPRKLTRQQADLLMVLARIISTQIERQQVEEEVRRSEERFRSLVQHASDITTVLKADGTIRYESPSIKRLLGYEPEELVGRNAIDLVHPEDAPQVLRAFARLSNEREGNPYLVEYRSRHADGSWRYLESSGTNLISDPNVRGLVVNSRDVTERKLLENRLAHQALHDPLTGLPNRTLFVDRLDHSLERANRRNSAVAMLFLDLDDFKVVNDSLGHECGDQLLVAAAERLRGCLRSEDTLARLGGDEFTILLEDVKDEGEAREVAERIVGALQGPFLLGEHEVFVSASVGIELGASGGPGKDRPEDLLRRADMAMYQAKNKGKAHYEVFNPHMNALALERLKIGNDLKRAVERGELRVHYQPKVLLKTREVFAFEALVRWEHQDRGLVFPTSFLAVAEKTGMAVVIGQWVLKEACHQASEWQEQHPEMASLAMCVNLSARQFEHPGLAGDVARILDETGLSPSNLILEITESVAMSDASSAIETFRELKALGVRLSIDDFGTGYSSLAYLKHFPVDLLKIDRSFVEGLGQDADDEAIVLGTLNLARALGLAVLAEGVETEGQLDKLREMGYEYGQGYLFSRPLPAREAAALLPVNGS